MVHVSTKLARIQASPTKDDSYIDVINYLAFAAQFSSVFPEEATVQEDDVKITDLSLLDITLAEKASK